MVIRLPIWDMVCSGGCADKLPVWEFSDVSACLVHPYVLSESQQHVASHANGCPGYGPDEFERDPEVRAPCSSRWNTCEKLRC